MQSCALFPGSDTTKVRLFEIYRLMSVNNIIGPTVALQSLQSLVPKDRQSDNNQRKAQVIGIVAIQLLPISRVRISR